jgi:hypothetical protein
MFCLGDTHLSQSANLSPKRETLKVDPPPLYVGGLPAFFLVTGPLVCINSEPAAYRSRVVGDNKFGPNKSAAAATAFSFARPSIGCVTPGFQRQPNTCDVHPLDAQKQQ